MSLSICALVISLVHACLFNYLAQPFLSQVLTAAELLHDSAEATDSTSLNQLAKAKFDFTGKSEKELSFRKVTQQWQNNLPLFTVSNKS